MREPNSNSEYVESPAPKSLLRVVVTLYVECGVDETAESVLARTKDRLNSAIVRAAVGHTIARVEALGNPPEKKP